ncbi:hypothetical protein [Formosa haliotis]|uniref:hypothetical protein n=1 Tax=Formosa haliotis TaxID=1555194 RepID=UPI000825B477|nr:hypothetical protein [Formosa haliotis]
MFFYIKLCAFLVFFARAYQFYFFGAPYRAFLWDESLLSPLVTGVLNMSWYDYATSTVVNKWIDFSVKLSSILLFIAAFVALFWDQISSQLVKKTSISIGVLILIILGLCLVKDKNYDPLQFFELSIQFAAPLVLLYINSTKSINKSKLLFWLKISIALTFIPHGLFAMGVIYVPGHFIDMTISILGVNETNAKLFLFIVGFLDVVLSIFLFIPKLSKYAFGYIIVWGFLTALARIVAGINSDFLLNSIHVTAYLTVYRLPHGLIPLVAFLLEKEINKTKIN